MNNMIVTLETIRYVSAIALCMALAALAHSETVPAGATVEFTIVILKDDMETAVREWLDYGRLRGIGQWRNSGKGRFEWEEIENE